MLEKGFLGPIGDDLPSLIPLLFALLVFFSTFSFSFGIFNSENTSFQEDIAVLNVSRILKGTNYITSYEDFAQKCASINISNTKYKALITNYFTAQEAYANQYSDDEQRFYGLKPFMASDPNGNPDSQKAFECPNRNIPQDEIDRINSPSAKDYFSGKNVGVKIYPLVVEDNRIVKPMHLVVVAWTQ